MSLPLHSIGTFSLPQRCVFRELCTEENRP
jgi:hypothetical protein